LHKELDLEGFCDAGPAPEPTESAFIVVDPFKVTNFGTVSRTEIGDHKSTVCC